MTLKIFCFGLYREKSIKCRTGYDVHCTSVHVGSLKCTTTLVQTYTIDNLTKNTNIKTLNKSIANTWLYWIVAVAASWRWCCWCFGIIHPYIMNMLIGIKLVTTTFMVYNNSYNKSVMQKHWSIYGMFEHSSFTRLFSFSIDPLQFSTICNAKRYRYHPPER